MDANTEAVLNPAAPDASLRERLGRIAASTAFIVVVAFLVRVCFYYFYSKTAQQSAIFDLPYGYETGAVAASIARGHGFSSPLRFFPTGPTAWFTPVYPYLLAGIFKLFGVYTYKSLLTIRMLQIIFSAFTCWPLEFIGTKVFDRKVGLASAWAWVFMPKAIYFPLLWVWDTALAGLLLTILFAATLKLRESDALKSWIGYGALWAFSAMVNPSLLAVLPLFGCWAIWPVRHRFARAARLVVAASLIFAAGVAPWTIRNYQVFHKFIPFRSNFGLELWLGNNPEAPVYWSAFSHPNESIEEAHKYARMTEIPFMAEKQRQAFEFMRSHPSDTIQFLFKRFEEVWLGIRDSPFDVWTTASLDAKATLLWTILFSLLTFVGTLLLYRHRNPQSLPFGAVMLLFPMVFYLTHPTMRYRYPMDAIMQILVVYAIACPIRWLAQRSKSPRHPAAQPATNAAT